MPASDPRSHGARVHPRPSKAIRPCCGRVRPLAWCSRPRSSPASLDGAQRRIRWAAAVTHLIEHYGLAVLFAVIGLESAGFWVPGETALIAAAVYAAQGHLSIVGVIVVAAAAAILGDNAGYWLGREGGRRGL